MKAIDHSVLQNPRHEDAIRILPVVSEWTAVLEAVLEIEASGRLEELERSGFEVQAREPHTLRLSDDVLEK